jgi:hypothetical protein
VSADSYTDAQIRAIASTLRAGQPFARDALAAADVIEQLYRERGSLIAALEHVRHAVDVVARDPQVTAATVILALQDALNEVPW